MNKFYFPDGWTCIGCGDEFAKDINGKEIFNNEDGTMCKECTNDEIINESVPLNDIYEANK